MTTNWNVTLNFDDGTYDYDLPHIFDLSDPQQGMKATVIGGNRADGSIVIPGGKKSHIISVRGRIFDEDGYPDITTRMATMKSNITTDSATLTLKHNDSGWQTDWAYTVRRIGEIRFMQSYRLDVQEYQVDFLVIAY